MYIYHESHNSHCLVEEFTPLSIFYMEGVAGKDVLKH